MLDQVARLVAEHGAGIVVVGMPYNMDGTVGGRGKDVEGFVGRLRERMPEVRVVTHDERLSSREADELLKEAGLFGEARKERRDSWSALVVLRDWIEQEEG